MKNKELTPKDYNLKTSLLHSGTFKLEEATLICLIALLTSHQ